MWPHRDGCHTTDNTVDAEMRRLVNIQLLISDDFSLQPLDATGTADFYELTVARHHKGRPLQTRTATRASGWP